MKSQDLRSWISQMDAAGEVQRVAGADRDSEIGAIVDIYQRKMRRQPLLFDDIPGYRHGYRVLANILTSVRRIAMTLGLPPETTNVDLVRYWRDYMKAARTIRSTVVNAGAVTENILTADDIDLFKIPVPK